MSRFAPGMSQWRRPGTILLPLVAAHAARAQCPTWHPTDGNPGAAGDGALLSPTTWDPDGAGPEDEWPVVAGGLVGAGDVAADGIAP